MEKRAFLRAEHMTAVLVIYIAGFIVAFLIYEAKGMLGESSFSDPSPLSEAAFWPLSLLQMFM